jgi:hypothetical protein
MPIMAINFIKESIMTKLTKAEKVNYIVLTIAEKSDRVKDVNVKHSFTGEYVSILMNTGDLYQYKINALTGRVEEWYDMTRVPEEYIHEDINTKQGLMDRLIGLLFDVE